MKNVLHPSSQLPAHCLNEHFSWAEPVLHHLHSIAVTVSTTRHQDIDTGCLIYDLYQLH